MRISTPTDGRRALQAMQGDLMVAVAHYENAMRQIDQGMPGFPSGLDGGGGSDGLNAVERLATTPDEARNLQRQAFTLIGHGYDNLRDLAILLARLGVTPSKPEPVKGDIPDGWCQNHYRLLHTFEPTRREGGELCRWCEDVQREHKALPSRALLDLRARKGRVSDADITRTMGRKVA